MVMGRPWRLACHVLLSGALCKSSWGVGCEGRRCMNRASQQGPLGWSMGRVAKRHGTRTGQIVSLTRSQRLRTRLHYSA